MTRPELIADTLRSSNGEILGRFSAQLYNTSSELYEADHFAADDLGILCDLRYPLVYLRTLKVELEENRRLGHGSQLLMLLKERAQQNGARSAFARMSDPETTKTILMNFYSKNGWRSVSATEPDETRFIVWRF